MVQNIENASLEVSARKQKEEMEKPKTGSKEAVLAFNMKIIRPVKEHPIFKLVCCRYLFCLLMEVRSIVLAPSFKSTMFITYSSQGQQKITEF
ncbi:hypothetical protein M513_13976, partial [Trichuris suis]